MSAPELEPPQTTAKGDNTFAEPMLDWELESPQTPAKGDVSFLIGSGFSAPANYPTTAGMNGRLAKIDESEICIHTSGNAWFLNGQKDPNAEWMRVEERHFVQEFLEFYRSSVLGATGEFNYETFYDYYVQLLEGDRCPARLVEFFREFRAKHSGIICDDYNLLRQFHLTFSQLIASLCTKKIERSHLAKPYQPNYEKFLLLVEGLGKNNRVHFHSLNHDLWLERLAISDSFRTGLDDGFEELGSPFYGEVDVNRERYTVRLSRFTNKFDGRFRLYKLHGSIDRYWFRGDAPPSLLKLRWGISPMDLYKEMQVDGVYQYVADPTNYFPDFLTGTTRKVEGYKRGLYYPAVLRHFELNLSQSSALIVIGYGFGDIRINDYVEKHFLSDQSKPVFIVDVKKPKWKHVDSGRVHFDDKGVSGMDIDFILRNLA